MGSERVLGFCDVGKSEGSATLKLRVSRFWQFWLRGGYHHRGMLHTTATSRDSKRVME